MRNNILTLILRIKRFKPEESILIFSEARGGSTWLLEMLSHIPHTCINWEPLHIKKGVVPEKFGFGFRPYIPADSTNKEYFELINSIHTFTRSTEWTRKYLGVGSLSKSRLVITKYVRANRLLPYILNNFKFKYPPVVLLRHPIDTCMSQIKAFRHEGLDKIIYNLFEQRTSNDADIDEAWLGDLNRAIEKKLENWCKNNVDTINQVTNDDSVLVVFYSNLLIDPRAEMIRILERYKIKNRQKIVDSIELRKSSKTAAESDLRLDPEKQLHKNFEMLHMETKDRIQRVFDRFDFNLYDAYSPLPKNG